MVLISKHLFYEKIGPDVKCYNIIHPFSTCLGASLVYFPMYVTGVFKFFLPVYLVKILIDKKKLSVNRLKKHLFGLIRSQIFGTTFAFILITSLCLSSNLQKRLYYSNIVALPGFLGSLSIFIERPAERQLNALFWANNVTEAFLLNVIHLGFLTPVKQVLLFMGTTSYLMHLLGKCDPKTLPLSLWFFKPKPSKEGEANSKFISRQFINYFGLGVLVSLMKSLLKSPKNILNFYKDKKHWRSGLVFGGFALVYRLVSLLQNNQNWTFYPNAISGFLAGTVYVIDPTLNLLSTALTFVAQIILGKWIGKSLFLARVPLAECSYILCNCLLWSNWIIHRTTCPKYYDNMLYNASNGLTHDIYKHLVAHFFGNIAVD